MPKPSWESQKSKPLKLSIVMRWLSAKEPIAFTANIKWFDWVFTDYKPEDTISVTKAIDKLGELEKEIIKISNKKVNVRSTAGLRKLTGLPIFTKEGTSRNQAIRILDSVVDKKSGITITFGEIKQILNNIIRSTAPSVSLRDIIDSYDKAGKWIEGISPDVSCYYKNPEGTNIKGSGAVAVADALSLLVEPYSYQFGYKIENESKVEDLYHKLLSFKKTDKFGTGFLPGADVPLCQMPIVESTAIASIALCSYYSYLEMEGKSKKSNEVKEEIKQAVEWIMNTQFDEGYWSTYRSEDYKSYPDIQATQVALVALCIEPVSEIIDTRKSIKKSISYINDRMINDGWGNDFTKQYDLIATLRIIWALMTLSHTQKVDNLLETAMQKFKSKLKGVEKYHFEEIFIPLEDGTRSTSSTKWYIPNKPFIVSTMLRYYTHFKNGSVEEDMEKFIQDGILEIISSQHETKGWHGTENGVTEYVGPSSTYYHARALFHKAIQDYTYLSSALKVKE